MKKALVGLLIVAMALSGVPAYATASDAQTEFTFGDFKYSAPSTWVAIIPQGGNDGAGFWHYSNEVAPGQEGLVFSSYYYNPYSLHDPEELAGYFEQITSSTFPSGTYGPCVEIPSTVDLFASKAYRTSGTYLNIPYDIYFFVALTETGMFTLGYYNFLDNESALDQFEVLVSTVKYHKKTDFEKTVESISSEVSRNLKPFIALGLSLLTVMLGD